MSGRKHSGLDSLSRRAPNDCEEEEDDYESVEECVNFDLEINNVEVFPAAMWQFTNRECHVANFFFFFFFIVTSPRIHHPVWQGSPYDPGTQGQGYCIRRHP